MSAAPQIRTALLGNLKELHLPAMRACFEQAAQRAEKETLSYEQYLLELSERECEARRRNRIAKLLRESGLPQEKTLANFDLKRLPAKVGRQMKVLLDGGFLDRKENLLLFGNPGAGKSHLLCALAHELIAQGRRMKYTSCAMLVQELLVAKRDLRLSKEIKKLAKHDGLIIDEMGYVQQSREEMEVLFTLLAERYERGSVLLTSNLLCGAPHNKFNAEFVLMRRLNLQPPPSGYVDVLLLCITVAFFNRAISLSVALKRPDRRFGAMTDSRASSFTVGSARV